MINSKKFVKKINYLKNRKQTFLSEKACRILSLPQA